MNIPILIVSFSPGITKAILFLCLAAVIVAGPLIYRILSGEKFGFFTDPRFRRPGKKQWQQLRDKADRIIDGSLEIDADELSELANIIQVEFVQRKYKKNTKDYENDRDRLTALFKKLQDMDPRIEPFDSLSEYLQKDALIEQARTIHNMVHTTNEKNTLQLKKEFLNELIKIKNENWHVLSHDTKVAWKQSVELIKCNPLRSMYIWMAVFILAIALRLYYSIVEDKGYKFYKEHPVWIIIFAIIIGLPLIILAVKFLLWKYSIRQNPQ